MARLLVQTTLPHSRQSSKTFVRTNGALKVSVSAHPLLELPYGRYPRLLMAWVTTEAVRPYREAIPFPLDRRSNDGIVPTLSQFYGRVIDVVVADHLDVVGQFTRDDLPYGDWLPSGAGFDCRSSNVSGKE